MIEINLARQLQQRSVRHKDPSGLLCWVVGGVVFLGVGVASWWWTQSLQEQVDSLLQEKLVKTQSLVRMQERLKHMEGYGEERALLMNSVEQMSVQENEKAWPVALLDGMSRNIEGLDIWLERTQLEAKVVELHGQSLGLEDIGKYIERLENDQVIMNLPVIEIPDRQKGELEAFPFMIRFVFDQNGAT